MLKIYIQIVSILLFALFLEHSIAAQMRMDSILLHYDFNGNLIDQSLNNFDASGTYVYDRGINGTSREAITLTPLTPPIKLPDSLVFQRDTFQVHILFKARAPGSIIGIQHRRFTERNFHYVSPLYIKNTSHLTGQLWNLSRQG